MDRNSVPIDPAIPISGQVFRAAGYDTGYAGKWHMPDPYPSDGIAGFEVLNKTTREGEAGARRRRGDDERGHRVPQRKHDKPFLLVVSFINPHDICLLAGEDSPLLDEVWKKYQPAAGAELPPLPANFAADRRCPPARLRKRPGTTQWDENHWRRYRYAYYPHGRGRGSAGGAGAGRAASDQARRRTRSSSSPATTARAWARTTGPAR